VKVRDKERRKKEERKRAKEQEPSKVREWGRKEKGATRETKCKGL
jgi:hypothetical protein